MEQEFCPHCKVVLPPNVNFCPNCGKQVREPKMTLGKQLGLYLFSLLVPPFGIIPAIRYIRNSDPSTKKVGLIILLLTIVSIGINTWLSFYLINIFNSTINQQLNGSYPGL